MFNKEKQQRFSLRKLDIGLASICIGVAFLGAGQNVKADAGNNASNQVQDSQLNKNREADGTAAADANAAKPKNGSDENGDENNNTLSIDVKDLLKGGSDVGLSEEKPASMVAIKRLDDSQTMIYGRDHSRRVLLPDGRGFPPSGTHPNDYAGPKSYNLVIPGGSKLDNSSLSAFKASDLITYTGPVPSNISWVYDNSGTPLDSSHQYNTAWTRTHDSMTAYIKVSYRSGFSTILPVTVGLESDAEQYDRTFFDDVAHLNTHTMFEPNAPLFDGDYQIPSIGNSTVHDGDIPHRDQLNWGYDIDNVGWQSWVTPDRINLYKSVIQDFYAYGRHRSPTYRGSTDLLVNTDEKGDKYAIAYPGINIHYVDGSRTTDIRFSGVPCIPAFIYRPVLKHESLSTTVNNIDFFTPTSAEADLTNLANAPGHNLFNFIQNFDWVVRDAASNTVDGIKVTGFRKLAASDLTDIGIKTFYIMVRYTKTASGEQDGYYLLPVTVRLNAGIHATGASKTFDDTATTIADVIRAINNTAPVGPKIRFYNQDNDVLDASSLTAADFEWLDSDKTPMTSDPIYAGMYYLRLNDAGVNALKNKNSSADIAAGTSIDIPYIINKAKAKATLAGTNSKEYDGQAFEISQLSSGGSTIAITFDFPGYTSGTYTLQDGDFSWYTAPNAATPYYNFASGRDLGPVGTGSYYLKLNEQGQDNIKQWVENNFGTDLADSLDWSEGFGDNYATFTINPLEVKFSLLGHNGKKYDGDAADAGSIGIYGSGADLSKHIFMKSNLSGLLTAVNITNSDLVWTDAAGNVFTTPPVNVGRYQLSLTAAFKTALEAALISAVGTGIDGDSNVTFTDDDISSTAVYKIRRARAKGRLVGKNKKVYDTSAVTLAEVNQGGKIYVELIFTGANSTNDKYVLVSGDYSWHKHGLPLSAAPKDAGLYGIKLTSAGINHIESAIENAVGFGTDNSGNRVSNVKFGPRGIRGRAKFRIKPKKITVTYSGNESKYYDGLPGAIDSSQISWFGLLGTDTLNTAALTPADFDWYSGSTRLLAAPSDAGNYTLKLNDLGKTALANSNYKIKFTGTVDYSIILPSSPPETPGGHKAIKTMLAPPEERPILTALASPLTAPPKPVGKARPQSTKIVKTHVRTHKVWKKQGFSERGKGRTVTSRYARIKKKQQATSKAKSSKAAHKAVLPRTGSKNNIFLSWLGFLLVTLADFLRPRKYKQ